MSNYLAIPCPTCFGHGCDSCDFTGRVPRRDRKNYKMGFLVVLTSAVLTFGAIAFAVFWVIEGIGK
jgi:hypothetical protein